MRKLHLMPVFVMLNYDKLSLIMPISKSWYLRIKTIFFDSVKFFEHPLSRQENRFWKTKFEDPSSP